MVDLGPHQNPITEERIREMVGLRPRRVQLSSNWPNALHLPTPKYENWSLVLPFPETFQNAFQTMCFGVDHRDHVSEENRYCVYPRSSKEDEGESVRKAREWIKTVGQYVAIRDCLALSFALDYRTEAGDPQKNRTHVGDLCLRAKPYDAGSRRDPQAENELVQLCLEFLGQMTCCNSADCVVAMPPSRPDKPFDLPCYLASRIASELDKKDLCEAVRTIRARGQMKNFQVDDKLDELIGTVRVDERVFQERKVLIIDDVYQSGTSMNYVAMLLLQAGAKKVFGLACEKTLHNDDNIG